MKIICDSPGALTLPPPLAGIGPRAILNPPRSNVSSIEQVEANIISKIFLSPFPYKEEAWLKMYQTPLARILQAKKAKVVLVEWLIRQSTRGMTAGQDCERSTIPSHLNRVRILLLVHTAVTTTLLFLPYLLDYSGMQRLSAFVSSLLIVAAAVAAVPAPGALDKRDCLPSICNSTVRDAEDFTSGLRTVC